MTSEPILCTVKEAAAMLSIGADEVYDLVNRSVLTRKYIGKGTRNYRLLISEIRAYVDSLPSARAEAS